jgi:uncharacterized membrane protein
MTSVARLLDPKSVFLAKHAQHVVLVHFPIALFLAGVGFDLAGAWWKRRALTEAAYWNVTVAAWSTLPAVTTGLLAWRFQLEGQTLKGVLLLHLILACVSSATIGLVWWMHRRARGRGEALPGHRVVIELLGVAIVALTGHLGGFLSGVNGPG